MNKVRCIEWREIYNLPLHTMEYLYRYILFTVHSAFNTELLLFDTLYSFDIAYL